MDAKTRKTIAGIKESEKFDFGNPEDIKAEAYIIKPLNDLRGSAIRKLAEIMVGIYGFYTYIEHSTGKKVFVE